ncbi:MAG: alpha-galactosidase [Treponema sp.]|nr:alpha-galactosidase [Treponema sp.]
MDYIVKESYKAYKNSIIGEIKINDFISADFSLKNAVINVGGWQSWNPGYEVEAGKKQDSLKCHLIKGWNTYLVFPESNFKPSKNLVLGQFVSYCRWDNLYLLFASTGNINDCLPPVQFIFDRKNNKVLIEICDKGTHWEKGQVQAKIEVIIADSYFECKEKLSKVFGKNHFEQIKDLGSNPGGWESWYNHYANINEELILKDLEALKETENIISKQDYTSRIFQIDDGWEEGLGDWKVRSDRFPNGLKSIVDKIEAENYIPGLWLAPFIIDARSKTAQEHPEWLLRNNKGKLIVSGFNPLWGKHGSFYPLDLSNPQVINHLDSIIDKAINEWGFRYLKLDFLYAGMLYGKYQKDDASYKFYTNAIKTLTARKFRNDGKPVFYLGCGVPFEASYKYFPLSRIGCDTYEHWENKLSKKLNWNGRNSAYLNLKDTLGHAMWDKVIFANDPDVLFIRNENCSLTYNEKLLIAKTDILFGSQLMYSDDPANSTSEEEKKLTKEIMEFQESFKNKEFGLTEINKDFYKIFSKAGDYEGLIKLGNEHIFEINSKK